MKKYMGDGIFAEIIGGDLVLQLDTSGSSKVELTLEYNAAMELAFYIKENFPPEEE